MAKVGAFAAMLHGTLVRMKADGVPGNPVVWLQKYLAKHALVVGQQSVSCRRNIHWLEAELMKQAAPGRKPRLTENDKKKLQRALRSLITLPTPDNVYVAHRKLRELDTDKKELVMRVTQLEEEAAKFICVVKNATNLAVVKRMADAYEIEINEMEVIARDESSSDEE